MKSPLIILYTDIFAKMTNEQNDGEQKCKRDQNVKRRTGSEFFAPNITMKYYRNSQNFTMPKTFYLRDAVHFPKNRTSLLAST